MRGALLARHWETQLKRSTFPSLGLEKIWAFFHPTICLLSSSVEFPLNLLLDSAAVWERRSEYVPHCDWEGQVFFLAASSKEMVCFPWVSDCSGPVECKHAGMCEVALDTVDPLQPISGPWGLRFDSTGLPLCSVFQALKFPLSSPPLPRWNWHFTVSSILW